MPNPLTPAEANGANRLRIVMYNIPGGHAWVPWPQKYLVLSKKMMRKTDTPHIFPRTSSQVQQVFTKGSCGVFEFWTPKMVASLELNSD